MPARRSQQCARKSRTHTPKRGPLEGKKITRCTYARLVTPFGHHFVPFTVRRPSYFSLFLLQPFDLSQRFDKFSRELQFETTFTCTQETRKREERQETRTKDVLNHSRESTFDRARSVVLSPGSFVRSISRKLPNLCLHSHRLTVRTIEPEITAKVSSGNCEESTLPAENS